MKKIISLFFIFFSLLNLSAEERSMTDWMKDIPCNRPLNQISIPGSHDSGAKMGHPFFHVQDTTISRQLELGVRFFDIRLKADLKPGKWAETGEGKKAKHLGLYHSTQYMDQVWDKNVLPVFEKFLKEHPSEALIVLINREGGDKEAFTRLLSKTLKSGPFVRDYREDITLGECRGKILFLFRDDPGNDYPGARCSGWDDNVTCDVTLTTSRGKTAVASVEDEYYYDNLSGAQHKIEATLSNVDACMQQENSSKMFLSYASCTGVPNNTAAEFAKIVNPAILKALKGKKGNTGVVLVDFVEQEKALVEAIVETNTFEKQCKCKRGK